jgi:NAD(P)H-hydrate repair Nnr-like enzyme with NAD(P)H-hydrate epimerase domain
VSSANAGRARARRRAGLRALADAGGRSALRRALADADAVVDALFGTGLSRALDGAAKGAVAAINGSGRRVLAADLPSGLSADRGASSPAPRCSLANGHFASPGSATCCRPPPGLAGSSRSPTSESREGRWRA